MFLCQKKSCLCESQIFGFSFDKINAAMINVVQKINEKQINTKKDKIAMVTILCNT